MTPGQARGLLLSFSLLFAGVTLNAVYRQDSAGGVGERGSDAPTLSPEGPSIKWPKAKAPAKGAAPKGQTKGPNLKGVALNESLAGDEQTSPRAIAQRPSSASEATVRIARFAAPSPEDAPARERSAASAETIKAVERELTARGFGPIATDGSLGLATKAAIMAYEQEQGLPVTAVPSEELLKRLLLGGDGAVGQAAMPGEAATAEAKEVICTIQRALALLGYRPGPVDGRLSVQTVGAIRDFEVDRGLVPKGRVSAELVRQLSAAQGSLAAR